MPLSVRSLGSAFGQVGSHFLLSLTANVVAMLLSLPLLLLLSLLVIVTGSLQLLPLGVVLLLGVLPNPAAAGLQVVMHDLATHTYPNTGTQVRGLQSHWLDALKLWTISLAITLIIVGNIALYAHLATGKGNAAHAVAAPIEMLWLCALLVWCAIHLYAYPLLLEQKVKRTFLAYRNAAIMAFSHPVFTIVVLIIWLAILILSAFSGLVTLFGLAFAASIQQNAYARLLPLFKLS